MILTGHIGHFISSCPTNGDPQYDFHKVKKPAGIPKCFLQAVTGGSSKATLMMPGGGYAVMVPNEYVLLLLASTYNLFISFPIHNLTLTQDGVPQGHRKEGGSRSRHGTTRGGTYGGCTSGAAVSPVSQPTC